MRKFDLIIMNMINYASTYLINSAEYARILNVSDVAHT